MDRRVARTFDLARRYRAVAVLGLFVALVLFAPAVGAVNVALLEGRDGPISSQASALTTTTPTVSATSHPTTTRTRTPRPPVTASATSTSTVTPTALNISSPTVTATITAILSPTVTPTRGTTPRDRHTATQLANGQVLVAGGLGLIGGLASAELYHPSSGTWTMTGAMATTRIWHTATLLNSGQVLVVGGAAQTNTLAQASAELYDPATGMWTLTGSLAQARQRHQAVLLPNGNILVAGGSIGGPGGTGPSLASAEVYNPATGTWSTVEKMAVARANFTLTLLGSGLVLAAGGASLTPSAVYSSAELFDYTTGTWSLAGSMTAARDRHQATLLTNGQVLVMGGYGGGTLFLNSAELYNPSTGLWSSTGSLNQQRETFQATLLPSGQVLVEGGIIGCNDNCARNGFNTATAEIYDPLTATWSFTGSMATVRSRHTATLLTNGQVLVAGGVVNTAGSLGTATAELYNSATGIWTLTASM